MGGDRVAQEATRRGRAFLAAVVGGGRQHLLRKGALPRVSRRGHPHGQMRQKPRALYEPPPPTNTSGGVGNASTQTDRAPPFRVTPPRRRRRRLAKGGSESQGHRSPFRPPRGRTLPAKGRSRGALRFPRGDKGGVDRRVNRRRQREPAFFFFFLVNAV